MVHADVATSEVWIVRYGGVMAVCGGAQVRGDEYVVVILLVGLITGKVMKCR